LLLDVPREWSMFTHKWPPLAGRRRHAICGLFLAPAKAGSKHGLFTWLSASGVRLPEVVVLVTAGVVVHTHTPHTYIHTAIIFSPFLFSIHHYIDSLTNLTSWPLRPPRRLAGWPLPPSAATATNLVSVCLRIITR
jgi:hypothetical protein